MKKLISAATVAGAFLIAPQASAEIAGFEFEVGGYAWYTDLTGEISGAGTSVELGNDGIRMDSRVNGNVYVSLEHPVPIVPNVRISHTFLKNEGSGRAVFSTFPFDVSKGAIDISHTDLTLYWTPVDLGFFAWDIGASARIFSGSLEFTGEFPPGTVGPDPISTSAKSDINPTYGLLYTNFDFQLPITGLGIQVELTGGTNGKETAIDSTAKIEYTSIVGIGTALGYRYLDVDLESEASVGNASQSIKYKLDASGPFLSLYYRL
ncbi:Uncharacterised protein [BD1-7 clade bacterium]|uniref:Outer membrane protein beta-barrel domain-containing protein n=1 Tax=BD1-7 clade bacterium TaxID=2029982 RepID=A0A5S9Q8H0_9GAMM|nr:Uncharacterised protein [BD1-7 clade bacterium]